MEAPFKCDVGIPDEYYRMIGIIAAQWERLDFVLEMAVAEVGMHNPFEVGLLTLNLTFTAKIELILVYAAPLKKKAPDEWTKFHDVIQEIRRVNKLRNEYVHARWFVDPTQTELPLRSIARTYQGKLELTDKPTPLEDLERAASEIHKAEQAFFSLMQSYDLLTKVPPTPKSKVS